ncbi:GNAT family N-acetyltransferase [Neolewinella antarctica]|uniref:Ribosomal protein S18 acetylase RimI-like enzyme n=1 Tax=Neolewinella antarctica TaxID=442734 RepID=A0ABX0XCV1_9BACT|nr:N-acetyltransferase [Neolewinella antarctica]NJC27090.1 ribosomal protein S18 acetylase RimI-like enzyme [Neolewinella antarctica]
MTIRIATAADHPAVWAIFSEVIAGGDTYAFAPDTSREAFATLWFADYITTFVAEEDGIILGTYILKANQPGLGDHVANCGYMVSSRARGRGVGGALCTHSLDYARAAGFLGMQFNFVVSTNTGAVRLWEKFGFEIVGRTPNGFRHAQLGYVDTLIMYRAL